MLIYFLTFPILQVSESEDELDRKKRCSVLKMRMSSDHWM